VKKSVFNSLDAATAQLGASAVSLVPFFSPTGGFGFERSGAVTQPFNHLKSIGAILHNY